MTLDKFMEMTKEMMADMIKSLDDGIFISLFNEMTYPDNWIINMDDFNFWSETWDGMYTACRIFYGDFNPNDDYFQFNGYGNLESFKYLDDKKNELIDNIDSFDDEKMMTLIDYITLNEKNNTEAN